MKITNENGQEYVLLAIGSIFPMACFFHTGRGFLPEKVFR